ARPYLLLTEQPPGPKGPDRYRSRGWDCGSVPGYRLSYFGWAMSQPPQPPPRPLLEWWYAPGVLALLLGLLITIGVVPPGPGRGRALHALGFGSIVLLLVSLWCRTVADAQSPPRSRQQWLRGRFDDAISVAVILALLALFAAARINPN